MMLKKVLGCLFMTLYMLVPRLAFALHPELAVPEKVEAGHTEGLGTWVSALTKNISLSGGLVGVFQGSTGNRPRNHTDVVGRGDLVFNYRVGKNTIAVIDVEATGGIGLDSHIGNHSILNGVAGSSDDRVRIREAWVEHAAFNDRLIMTVGKIDLTNYFDSNAIANDENSQFLAGSLVNSAVLSAPGNGPGVRLQAKLTDALVLGLGYGSGDTDSEDFIDHGYGIAELDFKHRLGELEGNCRGYVSVDGAAPDGKNKLMEKNSVGFGFSIDQQVTDRLTLFGRYGQREKNVYATRRAWSLGWQYAGPMSTRKNDILAFAYGQIDVTGASSPEKLAELYYKAQFNEQIALTPVVQYLINPSGDRNQHNAMVFGLRSQILF